MERNQYDNDGCLERGISAEDQFDEIAKNKGWLVTKASRNEDINEHWDTKIDLKGESLKVDIKAMKKLKREDPKVQDEWVWVELHSVRPHDRGWLYGGKSDLIAFEKKCSFIIVRRLDLIELLPKIVDMKSLVNVVEEAKYKVYQREGRPDRITLIETDKLNSIKWDEWKKLNL
jgi:hypothetical protein